MSDFLPLAWRERKTKIALLIVAFWAEAKKNIKHLSDVERELYADTK